MDQDGVAIGRGTLDLATCNIAARPTFVFDDKVTPVISDNFCVSERATMSVEAPGANATTKVTGLALGQSLWAEAFTAKKVANAAKAKVLNA
jgi:hypothetical protein